MNEQTTSQSSFKQDALSHDGPARYAAEQKRFYNARPSVLLSMGWRERFSVARKILFATRQRIPLARLPEVKPDWRVFLKPAEMTRFIWFGHSTVLMNVAGIRVLFDPVFSLSAAPFPFSIKRFQTPVVPLKALPDIDVIVISHNHYDHLDKQTIAFFREKQTRFITPLGVGNTLRRWGISAERITELDWYQSHTCDALTFVATPARHASGRTLFDHNRTLWCSWVIKSPTETHFFSGDSGYDGHFRVINEKLGPFDLAFVENGQYNRRWPDSHMSPEETIQAVLDLAPRRFIPIHWGMFTLALHHWTEPVIRTQQLASTHGLSMLSPRLGEVASPLSVPVSPLWWESFSPDNAVSPSSLALRENVCPDNDAP